MAILFKHINKYIFTAIVTFDIFCIGLQLEVSIINHLLSDSLWKCGYLAKKSFFFTFSSFLLCLLLVL